MAAAIVEKTMCASADGVHQQVEVPVPIDVGKHHPGAVQLRASHPGGRRHVFKLPMAEVAIEHVAAFDPGKVKVAEAIPVDVASGDS